MFAGWQTAALKAHRKPLLWPWPWGACSGSGLGPGVPAGHGVWRVWKVLERFGGFEGFGSLGGQTVALKVYRKPLLWPWPWGACRTRCLEGLDGFGERPEGLEGFGWFGGFGGFWRVFGGFGGFLERLEGFGAFGVFAGWQTAANRKPLLWPWCWGA